MTDLPNGLYDLLHTSLLHERLEKAGLLDRTVWKELDADEVIERLSTPLAHEIAKYLSEVISGKQGSSLETALEDVFQSPNVLYKIVETLRPKSLESLQEIKPLQPIITTNERPDTPLSVSALLTGSSRSPALRTQLIKELITCDRADWLVSFIKFSGILPLLPALREFTQTPAPDGGLRLRIATTSYMGATDVKAIKTLLELPNTQVRVSYDTKRTRLHAKAYLFYRDTGFGSAYIGSANVSKAALDEGLEWTAKISQYETEHLWKHAIATFESHWEDESEFTSCEVQDLPSLEKALSSERGKGLSDETISFFDLRPYSYQKTVLEDITAERVAGKYKHLIIAATGTGKTMIAAFDYKNYCSLKSGHPKLLFIAHREEILNQACSAFRQVLRDGSFGDVVVGGKLPTQSNHLFCSVQSWNSRNFDEFASDFFDYVVLDEAHHASASSYQKLIKHISPDSLLGLTATPERTDGQDIRQDFGGTFTHEIRLPEAIEKTLLSPFHYYGVPDLAGLDFSSLAWKRGGYDIQQLREQLEGNSKRAKWVMDQTELHVSDIHNVRGIGFCVSVEHAEFMATFCNEHNISAIALSGETSKDIRRKAQQQLESYEVHFIFTVDLYNEGVDIPSVNTVLFLRPTESLTLFLQQLGRGLRLHEDKSHLTVLDFIAPQHRRFSFAKRFQALTSRPELRIDKQIERDMPYVPSGCLVYLEKQAKEDVLNNIRSAAASLRGEQLLSELRRLQAQTDGNPSLQQMIDYLQLDTPDEIYKRGLPHVLLSKAEGKESFDDKIDFNVVLAKGFRRLSFMDDTYFIEDAKRLVTTGKSFSRLTKPLLHSLLWNKNKPEDGTIEAVDSFITSRTGVKQDLIELFDWLLTHKVPLPKQQLESLTGPLTLHASYTREQILLAVGLGSFEQPRSSREGVLHVPNRKIDIFFADINKSELDFSPTTMYEDYAISNKLFHWQSQSQTGESSPVGKRYINHEEKGYTPLLFIRDRKKLQNGLTAPYLYVGPLKYKRHERSKPISFVWEIEYALPARCMMWAQQVK